MKIHGSVKIGLTGILLLTGIASSWCQSSKHSAEIGIRYGSFTILGDVDHEVFPGWGTAISYRKSLNPVISLRPTFFYGITHGLDADPTTDNINQEPLLFEGYSTENPWFFAYQTKLFRLHLQAVFELSNLGPEPIKNTLNYYLLLGAGFNSHGTWLNLRDENNKAYTSLRERTGFGTGNDYNTSAGRKNIRTALQAIYDDTYESPATKETGKYRLGDETNIDADVSVGLGIAYRLSPAVSVSLEHEYILTPSDYLDGNRWRTAEDATSKNDRGQYTSLGISFVLSSKRNPTPLHWTNPWLERAAREDSLQSQIDSLVAALADDDLDGVINAMDEQPSSTPHCPVDVKGITSDLDRDGIPDCHDKFPFINKGEIESVMAQYLEKDRQQIKELMSSLQSQSNTHLEDHLTRLIFFGQDSDVITAAQMASIAEAAVIIKEHRINCITITGHADASHDTAYNHELGLRRATRVANVLREYFELQDITMHITTQGENQFLMRKGPQSMQDSINRRVQISICN